MRINPAVNDPAREALGVFGDNRKRPIHRWYPFVEGYSSALVEMAIGNARDASAIFDPFGGSGTTALTAAQLGHDSSFTEANPYMSWLAHVKVNVSRAATHGDIASMQEFLGRRTQKALSNTNPHPLLHINKSRQFFPKETLRDILATLARIDDELVGPARDFARVALATTLTPSSNMLRRTDLRRRKKGDPPPLSFLPLFEDHLRQMIDDIQSVGMHLKGSTRQLANDAKAPYNADPPHTLVITSPPYLNGTNYSRNTKLEMITLGFLASESDLETVRSREVTAGINNVARRNRTPDTFAMVEETVSRVANVTYDSRIPRMIRSYFSDIAAVLIQLFQTSSSKAELWLDIGDSRYSGEHVETHSLLAEVASECGWDLRESRDLRKRRSYDGGHLTQKLLVFDRSVRR